MPRTCGISTVIEPIPFPILGVDTDNGGEFINAELIDFCEQYQITFTRGRAYKKNDQCFVEQKNGVVVRHIVGYDLFECMQAYKQLNELYRSTRLYVNFFQPSMKLHIKHRNCAKVQRTYDPAKTPFHRSLFENIIDGEKQCYLENVYESLDPIRLLQQIKRIQDSLWKHSANNTSASLQDKKPVIFNANECIDRETENINEVAVEFMKKSLEQGKRKYRRTKKTRVPHTWRTVPNPFKDIWSEAVEWLEAEP